MESNQHTIMLVDDEVSIVRALQRLFRREGYKIMTATSGPEGLNTLRNAQDLVALIISDQRMPGMSGAQFLEKAREIFPNSIRFLLTGYSDVEAIIEAVNRGEIHRYLTKPWNDNDLLLQVKQGLEQYDLLLENKRLLVLTRKQNARLNELNKNLEQKVEMRTREIIKKNKQLTLLNKELENNLFNTVRAFTSLTNIHTPVLAGHGRRVSMLAREMAQVLDLSQEHITNVEIGALLHDIGKLGLSRKLLEYDESGWNEGDHKIYRHHPEESQAIVRFIDRLEMVGPLVRHHHERFDGQGFPDKLGEDDIPVGARIIAVADEYDKIVNLKIDAENRIDEYLKEENLIQAHLPENELLQRAAIHQLKKGSFSKFDPDVVKAFLTLLKERGMRFGRNLELDLESLQEGMILARSIYTGKGKFLLPHNTILTGKYIEKLKIIHKNDPIQEVIYIMDK